MENRQIPYFDRDLSWLSFNRRVLEEAKNREVPLLERIRFLGIFSSNLDEFYRVRMPVLMALHKLNRKNQSRIDFEDNLLGKLNDTILSQQNLFGQIMAGSILPSLKRENVHLAYGECYPELIRTQVKAYFLSQVLGLLQPILLNDKTDFFPSNNQLYFLINGIKNSKRTLLLLNIPSNELDRLFRIEADLKTDGGSNETHIVFLDDVIRYNLKLVFKDLDITGCYSFKITRDAELDLKDEYPGTLSEQIEAKLVKRDFGLATRVLYEPGIPQDILTEFLSKFNLTKANLVEGGRYHNLRDLNSFPITSRSLSYPHWGNSDPTIHVNGMLIDEVQKHDIIIHTPYHSYNSVLRFFNEVAIETRVVEIYVTLYRIASNSKLANALISAATNGKKVTVVVELKARFDEANNIKWAKKMKEAGVNIIYSAAALKVHAKIALIKYQDGKDMKYTGLLATGNFNESTAAYYTDHILMTANGNLLKEMEMLFAFLSKKPKPDVIPLIEFNSLLVAQFNLKRRFIDLIEREIRHKELGRDASIVIKMNNLEERELIAKLYQASGAGVKITLIIRSVCCLIPGVEGLSENIKVIRIVDRYLEHGRLFLFSNNGSPEVFLGSADWMNRNIYRRIEVCFPIFDPTIKGELIQMLNFQIEDNVKAVRLDESLNNVPVKPGKVKIRSQEQIANYLSQSTLDHLNFSHD